MESVPNRNSPPAILLREGYRENGKVKKRTLANLSHWEPQLVEHFRVLLRGGVAVASAQEILEIERSLPHGHVAAVLGSARACGAQSWFAAAPESSQSLLLAMVVARVLSPASKLATHRMLHDDTACNSLGRVLGVGRVAPEQLYAALDWLHEAQPAIERRLARQHLAGGSTLVLYDLTSTWLTGRCCELAARGHSRDGKHDDPQIVFGLVCTAQGIPLAVEVFAGNTGDPATVDAQVSKVKERFGIEHIAWVGDRGMLTSARIEQILRPAGMDWVSSLGAPQIAQLAAEHGPFQPSLFDERNLLEITSEHFPGERLVVCRNPLRGEQAIALRVGRAVDRFHIAKHVELTITDQAFTYQRKAEAIRSEAALDGLYVIRTSVPADQLDADATVAAYKSLVNVKRAFRSMKTVDLNVRPVFHYSTERVRTHVFLCMLAYYVEWHLREQLKPMLFDDEFIEQARATRASPVAKAVRSTHARAKDARRHADDGIPLHSFRTLLADLATITYNVAHTSLNPEAKIIITTRPTALQDKALRLLGVRLDCSQ